MVLKTWQKTQTNTRHTKYASTLNANEASMEIDSRLVDVSSKNNKSHFEEFHHGKMKNQPTQSVRKKLALWIFVSNMCGVREQFLSIENKRFIYIIC